MRGLQPWRWIGVPMLQVAIATILFGIPIKAFGLQLPQPIFPMTLAFAWAVIRPSILAPFAVLILGVIQDLYWGGPLGLWPLCLLIAYAIAFMGRSMMAGQNRLILWAWYGLATATAMVAGYLFVMLDARSTPGLIPMVWQFLATIVLYPYSQRLIDLFEDADVRFR
jgi:rod shape-determining protein MreD